MSLSQKELPCTRGTPTEQWPLINGGRDLCLPWSRGKEMSSAQERSSISTLMGKEERAPFVIVVMNNNKDSYCRRHHSSVLREQWHPRPHLLQEFTCIKTIVIKRDFTKDVREEWKENNLGEKMSLSFPFQSNFLHWSDIGIFFPLLCCKCLPTSSLGGYL